MIWLITVGLGLAASEQGLADLIEENNPSRVQDTLAIQNYRQEVYDFTEGFLNGIQYDPINPSHCIVSIISLKQSWGKLFDDLSHISFEALVSSLFNFNDLLSKFESTYGLCSFSQLYSIIFPETLPKGLNSILKRWLLSKAQVEATIEVIQQNLNQSDYVSAGRNSGKLFTLLTGYIIK